MKFKSISVGIGLSIFSNLLAVNFLPRFVFNSSRVLAEEISSSCPLPSEIAITFLNSKCQEVKLEQPQTFYRYYSSTENRYGRYLTADQYKTNVEVIKNLALDQSWGNKATMIQPVTLPAGMTVYQGIVAPQTPTQCYPGGGQQTFIKDTRDPNIKWSEGQNIVIKDFSCP
ncbi:hypothetical protein I8751_26365 [Nostocaceae cyanobacterium CENA357]|uniref:Uncharacterized protein n=1 Tax=Atlanticothrix silvestris CENA357 TaxID=1725252 RepID=A0A8J7HJ87_9CYAN|nr:hypothetical protein [Atlanticothrix silvestris]MBH8555808.1 hypothetical protein [Atlanticothrix silvestris CENA357]